MRGDITDLECGGNDAALDPSRITSVEFDPKRRRRYAMPTRSKLVPNPNPVTQGRLAILRDWHIELRRERCGLLRFEGRRHHFPVAADRFIHHDRHRTVF